MEKLIKEFLSGYGDGDGYGYGSGSGDGYSDGSGYGYGYGDGHGDGNGSGYGYGDGYGSSNGKGYGDGDDYGYGYGDGDGYGDGYGDGSGDGSGSGYSGGLMFNSHSGNKVYYIDNIPCVFKSVKGNIARVEVINLSDFSTESQYIGKFNTCFAHGRTVKKAIADAERKYYSSLDRESSIALFKEKFKEEVLYPNEAFYKWHSILTGSCDSGKDLWMSQRGITLDGEMTIDQFLSITQNAYGGEIIRQIINN